MKELKQYPIVFTVGILICLFSSALIVRSYQHFHSPLTEKGKTEEEYKKEYRASEEVQTLIDNLMIDTVTSCTNKSFYAEYFKRSSMTSFKDNFKIYLGILQYQKERNFENASSIILTKEEVKKGVEKVFGKGVTYQDKSYGNGSACNGAYDTFNYDAQTGNYTIIPQKCICKTDKGRITWHIVSEKITDTTISAQIKFVLAVQGEKGYTLYNSIDKTTSPIAQKETYSFEEVESGLRTYEFVFTKAKDGEFYFSSVALVK